MPGLGVCRVGSRHFGASGARGPCRAGPLVLKKSVCKFRFRFCSSPFVQCLYNNGLAFMRWVYLVSAVALRAGYPPTYSHTSSTMLCLDASGGTAECMYNQFILPCLHQEQKQLVAWILIESHEVARIEERYIYIYIIYTYIIYSIYIYIHICFCFCLYSRIIFWYFVSIWYVSIFSCVSICIHCLRLGQHAWPSRHESP